jgi:hypothetical protein
LTPVEAVEAFWASLRGGGEEARRRLVGLLLEDPEGVLEEISKRVGGDAAPDTVVARSAVEPVVAALALRRRVRLVVPRDPVPGWGPLLDLAEALPGLGLGEVYRAPLSASARLPARRAVAVLARLYRGLSASVIDVTDGGPLAVAAAQPGRARWLTVLVDAQYMAVFQRFWFAG